MKATMIARCAATAMFISLLGCSSDATDDAGSRDTMRREVTCAQTSCQQREQACHDRESTACDDCWDACGEAISQGVWVDCSSSCAYSCDDSCPSCDNDTSPCVRWAYHFELPETSDPEIQASCEQATSVLQRCGAELGVDCATAARILGGVGKTFLDCLATSTCDTFESACPVPPNDFGQRVCAVLAGECGQECDPTWFDGVAILNDAVLTAGLACMDEPDCQARYDCLAAWASW